MAITYFPMDERTEKVVEILLRLADYLEFLGENRFKVLAYRRAVRSIEESGASIEELYRTGRLRELAGVGEVIVKKVGEILETGKLRKLEEVSTRIPPEVREMIDKLPVSGGKVARLVDAGIRSLADLIAAAKTDKLEKIPGLGAKTRKKLLEFAESQG